MENNKKFNIEEIEHVYIYGLNHNEEDIDDRVTTVEEKVNEIIKYLKNKEGEE